MSIKSVATTANRRVHHAALATQQLKPGNTNGQVNHDATTTTAGRTHAQPQRHHHHSTTPHKPNHNTKTFAHTQTTTTQHAKYSHTQKISHSFRRRCADVDGHSGELGQSDVYVNPQLPSEGDHQRMIIYTVKSTVHNYKNAMYVNRQSLSKEVQHPDGRSPAQGTPRQRVKTSVPQVFWHEELREV